MHPNAIDPDASRQWIRRGCDRVREIESTTAMHEGGTVGRRKNFQEATRYRIATRTRVATLEDDRIAKHFRVPHDHRSWGGVLVLHGNRIELP